MDKLVFKSESVAGSSTQEAWANSHEDQKLPIAIPACFGGSGDGSSPEALLASALVNCLVGTFKVLANNSKLGFEKISGNCQLEVIQAKPRDFSIQKAKLAIRLYGVSNEKKANAILMKAKECGILLKAMRFPVELELTHISSK